MLKNYTSAVPVDRTLINIQKILTKHGANKISFDYAGEMVIGISFVIKTDKGFLPVKLPARLEKIPYAMYGRDCQTQKEKDQVYRTAWKNIHDWIDAQMALLETEMVKMEEIFLPYIINRAGQTFYEVAQKNNMLLGSGQ